MTFIEGQELYQTFKPLHTSSEFHKQTVVTWHVCWMILISNLIGLRDSFKNSSARFWVLLQGSFQRQLTHRTGRQWRGRTHAEGEQYPPIVWDWVEESRKRGSRAVCSSSIPLKRIHQSLRPSRADIQLPPFQPFNADSSEHLSRGASGPQV